MSSECPTCYRLFKEENKRYNTHIVKCKEKYAKVNFTENKDNVKRGLLWKCNVCGQFIRYRATANEHPENCLDILRKERLASYKKELHRGKKRYEKSKDNILQLQKKYRQENKKLIAAKSKIYYQKNKVAEAAKARIYYQKNKVAEAAKGKKYYEENKEAISAKAKIYREKNKEKESQRKKKYRAKNGEKMNQRSRKYYAENKEKESQRKKKYRAENREKVALVMKKYLKNNKEKVKQRGKKYHEENKDAIASYSKKHRAKKIKEGKYKCHHKGCFFVAECSAKLKYHLSLKHDEGDKICDYCKRNMYTVIEHTDKNTGEVKICRECYNKATGKEFKKEKQMSDYLDKHFGKEFLIVSDSKVKGETCQTYRPDKLYADPQTIIHVECDEDEHRNRNGSYKCDEKRISDIYDEFPGKQYIVIRWNPDGFKAPEGKKKLLRKDRLELLLKCMKHVQSKKFDTKIIIIYMFYSKDNPNVAQNIKKYFVYEEKDLKSIK